MQPVVVIIKDVCYPEGGSISSVHGVYVDLKVFYDEAASKGYSYDDGKWYYENEYGETVSFYETVCSIQGLKETGDE